MRPSPSDAVVVDFETFADLRSGYSLAKMSTRAYLQDRRFDVLSVAVAFGLDDEIDFFHKHGGGGASLEDAAEILREAAAAGKTLVSHNLDFDGLVLSLAWGISFARVFDTVGWLRYHGYAPSLANGAHLVGLAKDEAPDFDEAALREPARLDKFMYYNCKDVEIARALFRAAADDPFFTDLEHWVLDSTARNNLRGIRIDRERAAELAAHYARNRDQALATICRDFPTFDTNKLRSSAAVREYLAQTHDVGLERLDKRDADVAAVKASPSGAGRFLRLREAFDTWDRHAKKVAALGAGPDRIYGQLHYYGAHTGRFTAGGMNAERVNLQNLHKGRDDDFEDLALIRTIVAADDDESLVSSDLSTIEPRVLAFLAGEREQVVRFANDEDVYVYFIASVFPGATIVKNGENDHLRQLGKKAVLGLGYGQGAQAFFQKLRAEDPSIKQDLAARIHAQYRQKFPRINSLRWQLFDAFRKAADTGLRSTVAKCKFRRSPDLSCGTTVEILLPTNRLLTYRSVRVADESTPFGKIERVYRYTDDFQFEPKHGGRRARSSAGKAVKGSDGRLRSQVRPQTLIENVVSAVARDIIVGQMHELEHLGLRIKFTVHDEAVVSTTRCVCPNRDAAIADAVEENHDPACAWISARATVKRIMSKVPACFPNLMGLPVACELSNTIRDSYGC